MNDLIQMNENQINITNGDRIININIDDFNFVRRVNGYNNCCDLFLQFSKQDNSLSIEILYELARLLNENLPNNNIDWMSTFCVINIEIYNNALITIASDLDEDNNDDEINVFDNIEDAIDENREANEELSNEEVRRSFEEGIRLVLVENRIIN
jgi:hypothetical protein